ncbi:hypothetical protein G7B40_020360 [Aetokthonos hydrillicola Thurmond2011]|jgi:hypothetical protein|uniref:Uncharacterized protein n=1 Tax=Aetokthonos hydrillicola Thurmond2011 TaxID=2712845 RepID=A0AAP5M6D9_9CYAN|nr:hypothetical protein [Aetokthonos hydrillicola]MBO3462571.1 hypothetical protein [Aetokthonos hydrillicola CCALA 1050]MBW4590359.1 hypothetical protein [Aetokthonos hydrillicola CCALA 1050]MDR9896901.1 hypothetical protein [Aetokthonos hydrillicola Thurmond2011]
MFLLEQEAQIFDHLSNEYVQGKIVPISSRHIRQIELIWKPQLKTEKCWDENLDIEKYLDAEKGFEIYVLEYGSIPQGLIVLKNANCPSRLEEGKNLIYLTLVTVAPWNRASNQGKRNYKEVGTSLVKFAISHSFRLGFEGRIALHSIKYAESFFEKMPFWDGGYDLFFWGDNDNSSRFKYLEMSADEAELIMLDLYLNSYLNSDIINTPLDTSIQTAESSWLFGFPGEYSYSNEYAAREYALV